MIKSLAEQAKHFMYIEIDYRNRVHNRMISEDERAEIFELKFAELIIKEITGGILPEYSHFFAGKYKEDRLMTQQELSLVIEEHFGVE